MLFVRLFIIENRTKKIFRINRRAVQTGKVRHRTNSFDQQCLNLFSFRKVRFASTNDDDKTLKNRRKRNERRERNEVSFHSKIDEEFSSSLVKVNAIYLNQVKSFSRDLPDRLIVDYLRFATLKTKLNEKILYDQSVPEPARKRRRTLSTLPESLKTEKKVKKEVKSDNKLSEEELKFLHKCQPSFLYYEENVPRSERLEFQNANAKNGDIRSLLNQLDEKCRLSYICRSVEKWMKYLESNPNIVEQSIPTLHLLLKKSDDIIAYFTSLGLPVRPPRNALVFFHRKCQKENSKRTWADLTQLEKEEYVATIAKIKAEYFRQFQNFLDNIISDEYLRNEFFRNVDYAMKDYELAQKECHTDQDHETPPIKVEHLLAIKTDASHFEKIKTKLLGTSLTDEQTQLVEKMSKIVGTIIENLV